MNSKELTEGAGVGDAAVAACKSAWVDSTFLYL